MWDVEDAVPYNQTERLITNLVGFGVPDEPNTRTYAANYAECDEYLVGRLRTAPYNQNARVNHKKFEKNKI